MDEAVIDIDTVDTTALPDARDRELIKTDLSHNVVVVASAGTGKTEALIKRMVACVVEGVATVDSLVAITFTRMAAGEMRARFAERLRRVASTEANARIALRQLDRCFIGTIHAFCARMLRERSLEVGIRPDFTEVDEHEITVLWRRFWRDIVQQLYAEGDRRLQQLRDLGLKVPDLFEFFIDVSENSDLVLKPGLTEPPDLSTPLGVVRKQVDEIIAELGGRLPENRDTFMEQVDRAAHFLRYRRELDVADMADLLKTYGRAFKAVTQNQWDDRALAARVHREISPDLLDTTIEPALLTWRQYVYGQAAPLVQDIVTRFAEYRRANGLVTFHDLLVLSARLLRQSSEARRFFQQKFATFFVDEFQDTDPLQAEIIQYLTGEDVTETDWRKLVPRPASIFIVGDEKQSIYRFRRADIDVFRIVRDRIIDSGGRLLRLQTSFRSTDDLCAWLNGAFEPLFESHDRAYQAEYDRLLPERVADGDGAPVQRITVAKVAGNREMEIAKLEAQKIARYVDEQVTGERAVRSPGDFMILTRERRYLQVYAATLEARDIPYDIVGGDSLGSSEELGALVEMLEAIRRPSDGVSLLGYLRGPLNGLGDDELYAFTRAGGRFRFSAGVPESLDGDLADRLRLAFDRLLEAQKDLLAMPMAAAIERIIDRLGLASYAAGLEQGSTRAGNLYRVLSLVRKWEEEGRNWSEVVAELRGVLADSKHTYEQMTLDVGRADVVRIMNLHQAKGLQAPVVILADSYQMKGRPPKQHVSRIEGDEYLSRPIMAKRNSYSTEAMAEPVGWADDLEVEQRYSDAEELRNVYVAATRARDQLVVCRYPEKKDRGPWSCLYRALDHVPELTLGPEQEPIVTEEALVPVAELCDQLAEFWETAARPSWTERSVTGEDLTESIEIGRGRGAEFGSLMHEILEAVLEERVQDIESYARAQADLLDMAERSGELLAEVRAFQQSHVWSEVQASEAAYAEVPFAGVETGGHNILRGKIDLIYRSDDGWKIVDFKTHEAASETDIAVLKEKYRAQLEAYAEAWTSITGEPVAEAGLWLTERAEYVRVV